MDNRSVEEIVAGKLSKEHQRQIKEWYGVEITTLAELVEHGLIKGAKPTATRH